MIITYEYLFSSQCQKNVRTVLKFKKFTLASKLVAHEEENFKKDPKTYSI